MASFITLQNESLGKTAIVLGLVSLFAVVISWAILSLAHVGQSDGTPGLGVLTLKHLGVWNGGDQGDDIARLIILLAMVWLFMVLNSLISQNVAFVVDKVLKVVFSMLGMKNSYSTVN